MTTLYRVRSGDNSADKGVMCPTKKHMNELASAKRKSGEASILEKVTVKKLPKVELLAALYNRDGFAEEIVTIKRLEGVKKPKPAGSAPAGEVVAIQKPDTTTGDAG